MLVSSFEEPPTIIFYTRWDRRQRLRCGCCGARASHRCSVWGVLHCRMCLTPFQGDDYCSQCGPLDAFSRRQLAMTLSARRVADTSAVESVAEVPSDLVLSPATGAVLGSVGPVRFGTPARWLLCEHVPHGQAAAWEAGKDAGAGRDRRLGAPPAADGLAGLVALSTVMAELRPRDLEDVAEWPHEGPRAIGEVLKSTRGLNLTPFTYHDFWPQAAGIHGEAAAAWELRMLCQEARIMRRHRLLMEELGVMDNGASSGGRGGRRTEEKGPKGDEA